MIHNNYTMPVVSGSKAWQYFCKEKSSKSAKQSIILKITTKISSGSRLSVSLDEYRSVRNRRYLNINLHLSTKFLNLGMTPITQSLSTEKIVDLVESV